MESPVTSWCPELTQNEAVSSGRDANEAFCLANGCRSVAVTPSTSVIDNIDTETKEQRQVCVNMSALSTNNDFCYHCKIHVTIMQKS